MRKRIDKPRFPTGSVDPRVRTFLSPLNTNDGFYLSQVTRYIILYNQSEKNVTHKTKGKNGTSTLALLRIV